MGNNRCVSVALWALLSISGQAAGPHETATLTKPIRIKIPYGETIAPAGTRVEVIAVDGAQARINYMDSVQVVPIDSIKLESAGGGSTPAQTSSAPAASTALGPALARSVPAPAPRVEDSTFLVKTDRGQGSAFLLRIREKNYVVTNYHVLKGARTAQFTSATSSFNLTPSTPLAVANDRDLVRIPVDIQATLAPAESPSLNTAINVYGNPGGQQVITKESGTVLGVGPNDVEVSAKFIPGNSGGPIVETNSNKVVGVATYVKRDSAVPAWVTKKTRFEEARRFGVRIDDSVGWSPAAWSNLAADTELISSVDGFLNDSIELTRALARSPYRTPFSPKTIWSRALERSKAHQQFDGIVAAYNGACKEFAWAIDTPTGSGRLQQVNGLFAARIRAHSSSLSKVLRDASSEFGRTGYNFSTEYTRAEYGKLLGQLAEFGEFIDKNSDKIAAQQVFQLAPAASKESRKP